MCGCVGVWVGVWVCGCVGAVCGHAAVPGSAAPAVTPAKHARQARSTHGRQGLPPAADASSPHLVTALYEFDGDLLACALVPGQLHKAEGTAVQVPYLRGVARVTII